MDENLRQFFLRELNRENGYIVNTTNSSLLKSNLLVAFIQRIGSEVASRENYMNFKTFNENYSSVVGFLNGAISGHQFVSLIQLQPNFHKGIIWEQPITDYLLSILVKYKSVLSGYDNLKLPIPDASELKKSKELPTDDEVNVLVKAMRLVNPPQPYRSGLRPNTNASLLNRPLKGGKTRKNKTQKTHK
jgi:hypothetical protein